MNDKPDFPDPREEDIVYDDRRIARPDSALPDWYVSDAAYRPIPIAWFTAAIVVQTAVISAIFFLLIDRNGWLTIGLAGAASTLIMVWSWDRGIGSAGRGWQVATVIAMLVQFFLICLGASARL